MVRRSSVLALVLVAGCGGGDAPRVPDGLTVLAEASADLGGRGDLNTVYLAGRVASDSGAFLEDLTLIIGGADENWPLPAGSAAGYTPELQLVDVTGDGRPEAVVVAATGGSGGLVAAAVVMVVAHGNTCSVSAPSSIPAPVRCRIWPAVSWPVKWLNSRFVPRGWHQYGKPLTCRIATRRWAMRHPTLTRAGSASPCSSGAAPSCRWRR